MKKWHKPFLISALAMSGIGLAGSMFMQGASAATGQIYLTPSSTSVQSGNNVTLTLRINPGANVNAVQATVNFDATKLKFVGDDASASPFGTQIQRTQSGGTLSVARGDLSNGGTSADSIIDSITFSALTNSGSASVSITNANATYSANGNTTDPSVAGATVAFTAASCPAGQTGTPPNCTAPAAPAPPSTGTTNPGSTGTVPKPAPSTGTSTGASAGASNSGASAATAPKITANAPHPQYNAATVSVTSDVPTKAYVKYGLSKDALLINTSVSDLATSHTVTLDPANLIPGQTYYYSVVTTAANGTATQSSVASFKLKGLQLKVGVFDKNQKPFRNTTVTLHSTPVTVKTDKNGYASFTDVTPGAHHVSYESGGKTYSQEIQAINNIKTSGATQSAPVQNFSVVYSLTQSDSMALRYGLGLAALIAIIAASFVYIRRERALAAQPLLVANPNIVSAGTGPVATMTSSRVDTTDAAVERAEQLQNISGTPMPGPGSTVAPGTNDKKEDN